MIASQLQNHRWPDGSEQSYTYSNGQLQKVTLPNQSQISYANYQWQQAQQITSPGASKSLSYDALQRLLAIQIKTQAAQPQLLASRSYQYDAAGNITQIESDLGKTQYGYDQLDRLTKAQPDSHLQGLGLPQELYSYDKVHNRTSSAHQGGVWRYNADNQLTRYPSQAAFSQTPAVDTQVSYSPQGHTEQETNAQWSKHYRYNSAERLIGYAQTQAGQSSPTVEAHYRYDPFGRRISKTVTEGGNAGSTTTTTTYFIYSQTGLMGEMDASGALIKAYGFNPLAAQQGLWSTDPIWQANVASASLTNAATSYHYLHTDHLATPILATDKTGAITWKAVSEAFGATNALSESSITMNLRFPGQYWDAETGTHYNFHRDYRPEQGRYLQSDPIELWGGINFYVYAQGNTFRFTDRNGLSPKDVEAIIGAIQSCIKKMNENGVRSNNKYINNYIPGNLDCGEQIDFVISDCLDRLALNDNWSFVIRAGVGHAWGMGRSSNPKDPIIWFDARANQISVNKECSTCTGWFGGSVDTWFDMPTHVIPAPPGNNPKLPKSQGGV